ncbi:MAG TPA: MDR family MFS transporter [Burkholderiaceae bacterium]|nr:MDR family MFS transporter [Burkholderiaceae bacterium]
MIQPQASPNFTLSHAEVRSVIIGLMLAILLGALDQTIVAVALPMMSAELQGFDLLAWVVSGYLVAVAVATPIYGKLGDLYGRRAMLSSAIAVFLAASVASAMAQSMPMLVAARIVQGLGGGGLISVAQATIADVVAPRDRGRFQGYISGAFAVASVSGPLAGGFLTAYLSWRWVFWINLPLGLAAFVISRRALARLPVPHIKRPVDYPGALLLSLGLSVLLIGITRVGQGVAWSEALNLRLFFVALAALVAFLWQERRAAEPIIPLDLLRMPTVSICCSILFIAFFQIVSLSVLIPLRLQMMTDTGVEGAALQLIPLSLAIPFGAYIGGSLTARSGHFKRIQLSGALMVPLAVLGVALIDPQTTIAGVLLMAVTGFGIGLQLPTSMVAVQNAVPHRHVGIATAVTAFSRSLGAAVGIAILMALLLTILHDKASTLPGLLSGADIVKSMLSAAVEAAPTMGHELHAQLRVVVQDAFQMLFTLSALVALSAVALVAMIPDQVLSEQMVH